MENQMGTLNKSLSLPRIASCLAVSLFMVTINSNAQEAVKKEKAEETEKTEKNTKAANGEKSVKGENSTVTAQLSGDKQVPSVETKATGKSTIKVDENKSIRGKVAVQDMTATAAHIHQGAPDKDGPVVIPLKKTSKNTFRVPANTKLTDAQFAAFKEGNLYVNVHSKKYPSGEVRAQMKP